MEAILRRRSIRKYTDAKISDELVKKLLTAGMSAPSAVNQKPWNFIVINDREKLDAIAAYHPHAKMLKEAPLAIMVCGISDIGPFADYFPVDCAASVQNILVAAEDLGLGAVWIGVYPREDNMKPAKKLLNLPENIVPFAFISIGYPNETKKLLDRYEEERVHYNGW